MRSCVVGPVGAQYSGDASGKLTRPVECSCYPIRVDLLVVMNTNITSIKMGHRGWNHGTMFAGLKTGEGKRTAVHGSAVLTKMTCGFLRVDVRFWLSLPGVSAISGQKAFQD